DQVRAAPNWAVGALLYVSYNLTAGAAFLIVMSRTARNRREAGLGGIFGGLLLGALIILIHIGMFVKLDVIGDLDMPTLALANEVHPAVGVLMAIALLGMMYNTAVGMFYSFTVRFIQADSSMYRPIVIGVGLLGFLLSLAGLTTLVEKVYATMAYIGFALSIAAVVSWIRKK